MRTEEFVVADFVLYAMVSDVYILGLLSGGGGVFYCDRGFFEDVRVVDVLVLSLGGVD